MPYTPLFAAGTATQPFDPARAFRLGDRGSGRGSDGGPDGGSGSYEYSDQIELAINVALAAGRPLLVRGKPGTGKSSLAASVASLLSWRFYTTTVSSRTTARDLLWTFDTVARLADAQAGPDQIRHRAAYLSPGPLWWAFNPESARWRGVAAPDRDATQGLRPALDPSPPARDRDRAVVLIDEIDKADPDVPNDLLVPLGSFQFTTDDGQVVVAEHLPLVIITTNEERDLPKAFLRRCVILALEVPDRDRLASIARRHFPDTTDNQLDPLLAEYERITRDRVSRGEQPPSVAELLDALAACRNLGSTVGADRWPAMAKLLLDKALSPRDTP
jgi:MoxR-like ATPase